MKTKLFFPALCALMVVLVACGKKDEPQEPKEPATQVENNQKDDDKDQKPDAKTMAFSVSETKKVLFAPGNLQYQASTNTWRFAEHQYDIIGEDNSNISLSYSGWIDLFGWGTGNNPTNKSTSNADYSAFVDWGTNHIDSYSANTWRTLSSEEWNYIFSERQNALKLYGSATVNGQTGVIVIPDNTTLSMSFSAGMNGYSQNVYSATEWEIFEKVGALFLPASGYRDGTALFDVSDNGDYWSSTPCYDDKAYNVYFNKDNFFNPKGITQRSLGQAVRLAQDL